MAKHTKIFVFFNIIGIALLVLSIIYWPSNFFYSDNIWHWVLPLVVISGIGFLITGCAIYAKGKGYGYSLGMLAFLGPLGLAILLVIENKAKANITRALQ